MIIDFKLFEKINNPDLRKLTTNVLCIENIPSHIKDVKKNGYNSFSFIKNKYYKISGLYGDPQRAIEEFGITDYVPVQCISKILIVDENSNEQYFKAGEEYTTCSIYPYFFDYFELSEIMDTTDKYNI